MTEDKPKLTLKRNKSADGSVEKKFSKKGDFKSGGSFRSAHSGDGFKKRPYSNNRHQGPKDQKKSADLTVGSQTRAAAALCVNAVEEGKSMTEALPFFTRELDDRDRSFVQEIVYGTLRHKRLLSATAAPLLDRGLNKQNNVARTLIICAIYQLIFTRAPAHAVVSATVGACQLCHIKHMSALINAVLRRFLREGAKLIQSDDPCVEHSFPQWLFDELEKTYGDRTLEIVKNSNEHAPMFLRVDNSKISTVEYLKKLETFSIGAKAVEESPCTIVLDEPAGVDALPYFDKGYVSVQDISAQRAALLLDLKPGMKVLDACCAPGGKSAHILDITKGQVDLTCSDIDEKRLVLTQNTLKRLNYQAKTVVCDVSKDTASLDNDFDRILVDAPCSGTGVIRRHPDIKWLRRRKDIEVLNDTQKKILDNAFAKLKSGGILVYTTCSVLKSENEDQANAFLERHPDAKALPFDMHGQTVKTCQVLPGEYDGDGFFYARFIKE